MNDQNVVEIVRIHVKNNQTQNDFFMYLETDNEVRDFLNSLDKRIYTVKDITTLAQEELKI